MKNRETIAVGSGATGGVEENNQKNVGSVSNVLVA
jgi:hypothetical protein